jgi:hypothetical protein
MRLPHHDNEDQTNFLLHIFLHISFRVGWNRSRTKHLRYPHADSKSAALKSVSVRLRPRAPLRFSDLLCSPAFARVDGIDAADFQCLSS